MSHASSRHPAGRRPKVSHTRIRVGSPKESRPPSTWTESGLTPILPRSSSSPECDGPDVCVPGSLHPPRSRGPTDQQPSTRRHAPEARGVAGSGAIRALDGRPAGVAGVWMASRMCRRAGAVAVLAEPREEPGGQPPAEHVRVPTLPIPTTCGPLGPGSTAGPGDSGRSAGLPVVHDELVQVSRAGRGGSR